MHTIDITPTPRILRTLGDIPFEVWQCLAELTDNSLDAFRDMRESGVANDEARVDIYWSKDSVASSQREIVIQDNGPGMSLDTLRNAARAGYSSNDPINNLGLFGMGFNIATARLGEETTLISTTPGSSEWTGVVIDFAELIKNGTFSARVVTEPKSDPSESGTKIRIRRLRDGVYGDLKNKESAIRRRLEVIYSFILQREQVDLRIQNKTLRPFTHCTWGESRFTIYKGEKVMAHQEVDRDLGVALFDQSRNRYLSEQEIDEYELSPISLPNVVKRPQRLKGWIGLQRYSEPSDFGVDFIRNGRKILVGDKSLFGYENLDTGTTILEYPIELASTVGGRIVGELHVDFLLPTYQKNGFDRSNRAWQLVVDAIRGAGPILPKQRSALGYSGDNTSPLGTLVNAFRRSDPGTKCLALRRDVARSLLGEFRKGNVDYIADDRWFKALQEEDKARGLAGADGTEEQVDSGESPSDDIDGYLGFPTVGGGEGTATSGTSTGSAGTLVSGNGVAAPAPVAPVYAKPTSEKDGLIARSDKQINLSGRYSYSVGKHGFDVVAWKVKSGHILRLGQRVPCALFQDGVTVDFFFDETHPLIAEYPVTPKQMLLQFLAERFAARDPAVLQSEAHWGLITSHLMDERIHLSSLRERAAVVLGLVRDLLPALLEGVAERALNILRSSASEVEKITNELLDKSPELYASFQAYDSKSKLVFAYSSEEGIINLIREFPELFMDGKVFTLPFLTISTGDDVTDKRFRAVTVEKISGYLKDLITMLRGSSGLSKAELIRYANTLSLFESRLV